MYDIIRKFMEVAETDPALTNGFCIYTKGIDIAAQPKMGGPTVEKGGWEFLAQYDPKQPRVFWDKIRDMFDPSTKLAKKLFQHRRWGVDVIEPKLSIEEVNKLLLESGFQEYRYGIKGYGFASKDHYNGIIVWPMCCTDTYPDESQQESDVWTRKYQALFEKAGYEVHYITPRTTHSYETSSITVWKKEK